MFNKTVNMISSFPSTIKIEEKKAPTDESIALAKQIENEVRDSLIYSVEFPDNIFAGRLMIFHQAFSFNELAVITFKLNGKKYEIKKDLPMSIVNSFSSDRGVLMKFYYDEISAYIAAELIIGYMKENSI